MIIFFLLLHQKFHNVCYRIEERKELLSAINDFLDESVVLPPGDWDSKNLLSINEIQELRKRRLERKATLAGGIAGGGDGGGDGGGPPDGDGRGGMPGAAEEGSAAAVMDPEKKKLMLKEKGDPMVRSKMWFGGVFNDWRRRFPQ